MTKPDVFQGSVAVAETARDKASYSGFLAGLFETDVRWDLFTSIGIPQMSPAALDFLERFKIALIPLDPERVDSEGELPEPVLKTLAEIGAFGIKIPRRFGGLELTQSEYQKVATLCASFDASLTVLLSAAQSIGVPEPLAPLRNRRTEGQVSSSARAGRNFRVCTHGTKCGLRHFKGRNVRCPRHRKREDRRLSPHGRKVLHYEFC